MKADPLPLEVRLCHYIDWNVRAGNCWLWRAATDKAGYGVIGVGKRTVKVHRVVYELAYKVELAPTDVILHLCDTPFCVNPDHLFRGNQADNQVDAALKREPLSEAYAYRLYCALQERFEGKDAPTKPAVGIAAARQRARFHELSDHYARFLHRIIGRAEGQQPTLDTYRRMTRRVRKIVSARQKKACAFGR